jgi:DNA-binding response OmpR family regulator
LSSKNNNIKFCIKKVSNPSKLNYVYNTNCKEEELIVVGDLELDLKEKVARRAGNSIALTAKEYVLLEYLMQNNGRVVSKVDIAESVWDINFDTGTNFVEVYINYLRKKVDKNYPEKLIHTMIGM